MFGSGYILRGVEPPPNLAVSAVSEDIPVEVLAVSADVPADEQVVVPAVSVDVPVNEQAKVPAVSAGFEPATSS